jgi:hypothetical protein
MVSRAVAEDGRLAYYEAVAQNAGADPILPENNLYWKLIGDGTIGGAIFHDETLEKSGTSETEFFHISKDEADAAVNAIRPSAENPFVTRDEVPEYGVTVGEFAEIPMPPGMGMIYGASVSAVSVGALNTTSTPEAARAARCPPSSSDMLRRSFASS